MRARPLAASLAAVVAGLLVVAGIALRPLLDAEGSPLSRLAALGRDAVTTIVEGSAPISAGRGLEVGIVLGAVLLAAQVDAICLGLRQPGIGALALAGVWSVPLVFERPPSTPVVLLGAASLVLMLWAARPVARTAPPLGQAPAAVAVAASVAVLAVVLTPLAASAPGWASTTLGARWGTVPSSGLLSLSSDLDLRSDLGDRPDRTVLTYRTEVVELGPLRTSTVVDFDGRRWSASPSGGLRPTDSILWPESTDAVPSGRVDIQITDLDQTTLPIPLDPRSVSAGPAWVYDAANDVVVGQGASSAGLAYSLEVARRDLSAETLRADRPHPSVPGSPETELVGSHTQQITDLARSVAGEAGTAYDEAVALQSWFRDASRFTYATDLAPARSDDAVWDFLQDRRGYCVQFATAMTLMARSLGIPARVGVGFLPGERGTDGIWRVSAQRAHAWPELWFADAGWVRFEPTPAEQTGPVPVYADPNAPSPSEPEPEIPLATATPGPSASPSSAASAPPTTASGSGTDGSLAPLVAAGIALLAVAMAAVVARRRRPETTPERAWSRLRSATADSMAWSDATTPRQSAEILRRHLRQAAEAAPTGSAEEARAQAASAAVVGLLAVVEAERYAPRPRRWTPTELDELVETVLAGLSAGRAASPSAPRGG